MNARATKKLVAGVPRRDAHRHGRPRVRCLRRPGGRRHERRRLRRDRVQRGAGQPRLTVAANSTTLTEADESSVEGTREFNGALPEVTVTDTRTEVPEGAYWYVLGSASAFTGDAGEIGADNLGWAPPSSTVATPAWSPRVSRSSRPSRTAWVSSTRSSWSRRSTRPRSTRRVPGPPARTSRCARARTSRRARTTRPSRCPCSRTEPSRRPGDRSRPGTDRVVTRRVVVPHDHGLRGGRPVVVRREALRDPRTNAPRPHREVVPPSWASSRPRRERPRPRPPARDPARGRRVCDDRRHERARRPRERAERRRERSVDGAALDTEDRITWGVKPADANGPDGRRGVDLVADPGTTVEEHIAVSNFSDVPATFALKAADGYLTANGRFNMLSSDQESTDAGTWFTVQESVEVGPKETVVVRTRSRSPRTPPRATTRRASRRRSRARAVARAVRASASRAASGSASRRASPARSSPRSPSRASRRPTRPRGTCSRRATSPSPTTSPTTATCASAPRARSRRPPLRRPRRRGRRGTARRGPAGRLAAEQGRVRRRLAARTGQHDDHRDADRRRRRPGRRAARPGHRHRDHVGGAVAAAPAPGDRRRRDPRRPGRPAAPAPALEAMLAKARDEGRQQATTTEPATSTTGGSAAQGGTKD